jgi:hypothetical protein
MNPVYESTLGPQKISVTANENLDGYFEAPLQLRISLIDLVRLLFGASLRLGATVSKKNMAITNVRICID